jgi:hypothetical protein
MGDGITGVIYEATPDEIVPLRSRLAGPLDSIAILIVHLLVWGGLWLLIRLMTRFLRQAG